MNALALIVEDDADVAGILEAYLTRVCRRRKSCDRPRDSHASNLRRNLDAAGATDFFVSIRGVGYRLTDLP